MPQLLALHHCRIRPGAWWWVSWVVPTQLTLPRPAPEGLLAWSALPHHLLTCHPAPPPWQECMWRSTWPLCAFERLRRACAGRDRGHRHATAAHAPCRPLPLPASATGPTTVCAVQEDFEEGKPPPSSLVPDGGGKAIEVS